MLRNWNIMQFSVNKIHLEKCPVCGSVHLQPFLSCTDCYATGETFEVLQCADCGFKMTQDVPVEAEIGRYYESPDYISHTNTKKGVMNTVYHWVRKYQLHKKAKLVERACGKRSGRMLDIGTGTGYFVNTMYQRGWDVEAVEKSAQARAFAFDNFGLNVLDDTKLNDFEDQSFNLITMWHVMEHIEHLDDLWETLKRELMDGGKLVVAVPNCASVDAQRYKSFWAAYDVPRHLWHFTPSTMQAMANKHGFTICERHPMPFDGFYVSMLSEKYMGRNFTFIRGMFTGFLAWCSALAHKDKSSSMIYILRKKE